MEYDAGCNNKKAFCRPCFGLSPLSNDAHQSPEEYTKEDNTYSH